VSLCKHFASFEKFCMNFLLYPQNPINDRNSLTFVSTGHESIIFVFSGSVAIPASDITCPK
jgi:hypothetical protein